MTALFNVWKEQSIAVLRERAINGAHEWFPIIECPHQCSDGGEMFTKLWMPFSLRKPLEEFVSALAMLVTAVLPSPDRTSQKKRKGDVLQLECGHRIPVRSSIAAGQW